MLRNGVGNKIQWFDRIIYFNGIYTICLHKQFQEKFEFEKPGRQRKFFPNPVQGIRIRSNIFHCRTAGFFSLDDQKLCLEGKSSLSALRQCV